MVRRTHHVVLEGTDGQPVVRPLKSWVRQNLDKLPPGLSVDATSHEMRRFLQNLGWHVEMQDDRVLVVRQGSDGGLSYAGAVLNESTAVSYGDDDDNQEYVEEFTFGLERDLQAALRTNLEQLEPGLVAVDGGHERSVEAGRIDITARDAAGSLVVIEIKAGIALPESVAQVLAYMSCLAEEDSNPVRGMLVAAGFHDRVVQAARSVPSLRLHSYSFQFKFQPVG